MPARQIKPVRKTATGRRKKLSPEEIEADIKAKIEVLGKDGGYMVSAAHIIQGDTPPENVEAMIAAVKKHGSY